MGLDISTVKSPEFVKPYVPGDDDEPTGDGRWAHLVWSNTDFPEHIDGKAEGWYFGEDGRSFRAGSCSGYNRVRADLCRLALGVDPEMVWASPARYRDEPLYPLIQFSDCEGAIGPDTSKRLADALDALASRFGEMDEWSALTAENFRVAFREAADSGGFVLFH
jgi:hypothetical protein